MIIGISGKAQSGKDTVCSMIRYCIWYYTTYIKLKNANFSKYQEEFGINHFLKLSDYTCSFEKHAFADKLKDVVATFLDISRSDLDTIQTKDSIIPWLNLTVREILQKVGTLIKEINSSIWIISLLKDYHENYNWIISDIRYENEIEGIIAKDSKAILIRVERKNIPKVMTHSSEIELDNYTKWNYIINNDGTLEELLFKVKDILIAKQLI